MSAVLWIHIYIPNNTKSMGMRKLWAGGGGQFSAPPPAYYIILLQHISTGNVFLHIGGYVPRLTLRLHFPWPSFLRDSITRVFIRFLRGQHHRILLFHRIIFCCGTLPLSILISSCGAGNPFTYMYHQFGY